MIDKKRLMCLTILMLGAVPALAQPRTSVPSASATQSPASPSKALLPRSSTASTDSEGKPVVVTGKRHRGLFKRIGHFFSRLFHGKRRWYTTPSHRAHCKRHFRSYNAHTNSYRGRSGLRHTCVL